MKTKYFLIVFITVFFFIACSKKSDIDKSISEYVKQKFHNPESYEPVSTVITDTIYEMKELISKIDSSTLFIKKLTNEEEKYDNAYDRYMRIIRQFGSNDYERDEKLIKDYYKHKKESINYIFRIENMIRELKHKKDSILNSQNNNPIKYSITYKCSVKVPVGGIMLKTYKIIMDTKYNILSFDEIENY